ncbi:MFS transporter [Haloarchaeobius amylolyticus]|uniref:MFS transporter n=1 Tax=Haloarchaeobius amylolyticus TaxID=1198296 RepID=UPI00226E9930|nr:MFS transporter [Haloarchaeobius amylolyticus]
MSDDGGTGQDRSLIHRYYLFRVTNTSGFFLPVAIIILQDKEFGMGFVGVAYAVYAVAKLLLEVPTGYVGDWLGRRGSLAIGSAVRAVVIGVYPFLGSEALYLGLHVLWAVGRSFRSGTQDAWLYEILQARFDESDFARIESRGNTLKLVTDAVTAVAGGVLYSMEMAIPFVATAAIALVGIPVLFSFPSIAKLSVDPDDDRAGEVAGDNEDRGPLTMSLALRLLRLQLASPAVRWFMVYGATFSSLFVVTRIYEQPALDAVGVPVAGFGVLYAAFKLVSAGVASSVGRVHDAIGTRGVLGAMIPIYAVAYASIAIAPVLVVPVLFLNRGLRTMTRPVTNQYLNERLEDVGRATVLSGASMFFALVGSAARLVAGVGTELLGPVGFLPVAGVVLSLLGGVVWVFTSPVRTAPEPRSDRAGVLSAGD